MTPQSARPARRRLDAEQRRDAILEAARRLYATAPYPEVSVAQVAEAAGASAALVFHYFDSKAGLYAALVSSDLAQLAAAQAEANEALPQGTPARDRVRTALEAHLDQVADPQRWSASRTGGEEPAEAQQVRRDARAEEVERLRELLHVSDWARHEYALWGCFGFLDAACLHWAARGCPADERNPLIEAALGSLEGALGDWGG